MSHFWSRLVFAAGILGGGFAVGEEVASAQTCTAAASSSAYEWIRIVNIGSINNPSAGALYQNFTAISTSLTAGTAVPITVAAGFNGGTWAEYVSVYIDLNHNGALEANELVSSGVTSGTTFSGTVNIPASATAGNSLMRVLLRYGAPASPCGSFTWGEVEDYTVSIAASPVQPTGPVQQAWAVQQRALVRYSFDLIAGTKSELSRVTIPRPAGSPSDSAPRDVVELPDGRVAVVNGVNTPYVSIYSPAAGSWTHQTFPGWGMYSNENYGDIAYSSNALFVADNPIDSQQTRGIIRLDLATGAATRFATTDSIVSLAAGPDGSVYAATQGTSTVKRYNPTTLALLETFSLPQLTYGMSGLTVASDGSLYTFTSVTTSFITNTIAHYSAAHTLLQQVQRVGPYLTDIDVSPSGFVSLGTYGGEFRVFDSQLSAERIFSLGSPVYASFAAPRANAVRMVSDAGDYIGQGKTYNLEGHLAAKVNYGDKGRGVDLSYNDGASWWSLEFAGPNNTPLTAGLYANAQRFPFQSPTNPGESISGVGRGCNTLTGKFVVNPSGVAYGLYDQVTRVSIGFEQHCEGAIPALIGSVEYTAANTGIKGDANCDSKVDATDKQLFNTILAQGPSYYAKWYYTSCDLKLLDTNGDGQITAADGSVYP